MVQHHTPHNIHNPNAKHASNALFTICTYVMWGPSPHNYPITAGRGTPC